MRTHPKYDNDSFESRQQELLQQALEAEQALEREALDPSVSVDEARAGAVYHEGDSQRETTRILFVSRDTSLLNPTQQTLDGYLNVSEVFDEVHIVVLRTGIKSRTPVLRVADNVWVYTATATHWWWTPVTAARVIEEQLVFASGFRPDLVVARDPFECGWVAARIGEKFDRPTQVHLTENIASAMWRKSDPANKWRQRMLRYVLPKFASVRTSTDQLRELLKARFPAIADIETLPRFNNYQAIQSSEPTFDIKEKYRQFSFVILYVGPLNHDSTLHEAIDAARFVLRNPRVGMVVVGDGSARQHFIERTKLLGIERQVVFERAVDDEVSYFKTADILLVTDTTAEADEIVIKGAAAGIALLFFPTTLRTDLFVSEESALIAQDGKVSTISSLLSYFLNTISIRPILRKGATLVINERMHESPTVYRQKYRQSIESALFVGDKSTATTADAVTGPDIATPEGASETDEAAVTSEPVRV